MQRDATDGPRSSEDNAATGVVALVDLDRRAFLGFGLAALPALAGDRQRAGTDRRSRWGWRRPIPRRTSSSSGSAAGCAAQAGHGRGYAQIESRPGGHVVVAHPAAGAVSLLTTRPTRVRRVLRGLGAPRCAAMSSDGRHAFVSDESRGELVVVDLGRARIVAGAEVGAGARHLSLDPAGRVLWVALLSADAAPQHVSFGRGVAFVASGEGASVRMHDLAEGRVAAPRGCLMARTTCRPARGPS